MRSSHFIKSGIQRCIDEEFDNEEEYNMITKCIIDALRNFNLTNEQRMRIAMLFEEYRNKKIMKYKNI